MGSKASGITLAQDGLWLAFREFSVGGTDLICLDDIIVVIIIIIVVIANTTTVPTNPWIRLSYKELLSHSGFYTGMCINRLTFVSGILLSFQMPGGSPPCPAHHTPLCSPCPSVSSLCMLAQVF